ncbi:MAG: magnesium transporter CorA family protein [Acidobacteria bacterium]|jgi:magnesium/cobalt transport protein CorA|nr:magnesium transporter CorA family protein [Acidobacteriota bacterium]
MKILVYLYDESGKEKEVNLEEIDINNLNDQQLLWINILERDAESVRRVTTALHLIKVPIKGILRTRERPKIFKFQDFYHFFIISVEVDRMGKICPIPIDFLVGKNFVVTVHDGDVKYLQEFTRREKGERHIGDLDAESFVATMLDLHIVSHFNVLEKIEKEVDEMDENILRRDLEDEEFLKQMVKLRNEVSKLRRWFLPHRDIFYSLSRPDFKKAADADSLENFQLLNEHFESAVDSIESSRETVLSLFDLYTTKTSHRMNYLMKRLTFITILVGGMGVIAGVLGMNFEEEFFKNSNAFWFVIAGMLTLAILTTLYARRKSWF